MSRKAAAPKARKRPASPAAPQSPDLSSGRQKRLGPGNNQVAYDRGDGGGLFSVLGVLGGRWRCAVGRWIVGRWPLVLYWYRILVVVII
jgi:hypothetical protein